MKDPNPNIGKSIIPFFSLFRIGSHWWITGLFVLASIYGNWATTKYTYYVGKSREICRKIKRLESYKRCKSSISNEGSNNYAINETLKILTLRHFRCEDFLPHCSVLYKFSGSCCENYFDPKPYFSALGTCFTTRPVTINYTNPLDIVGVTVNVSKEYSKGISFNLYGPKFATNGD